MTTIMSSGAIMGSATLAAILAAGGDVLASESLVLIGAATGYGVLASLGGITIFELSRYITHPSKTYRLTVQSLTTTEANKTFTIEQHYPRYPLNTKVNIIERNGMFFVRKLGTT